MKIRSLIFLFLIALLVGVIVKVPVAVFIKEGRLGPAMVYGAQGTFWAGRASMIRLQNHDVINPSWAFNPLYLLLGKVKAHVEFMYLDGRAAGDVSINLAKNLELNGFEYSLAADQLTQQFANGFVGLEGDLNLQLDQLNFQLGESFVNNTQGYLGWMKAGVAYPISGGFGNISVNLTQDDESGLLQADISNQGGEVSVSGKASLGAALDYSVDTVMKPTASMTDALASTLSAAMPQSADGSFRFKRDGNLSQLRF